MAKSLRSKWKRKCRAVKRERYGKKELERLKKTLGMTDEQNVNDKNMEDISNIVTFTTAEAIKENQKNDEENIIGDMEVEEIKSKFHSKTLRNEHGAYPIWVHPRKIKKTSKKVKKAKGKVNKKKNK